MAKVDFQASEAKSKLSLSLSLFLYIYIYMHMSFMGLVRGTFASQSLLWNVGKDCEQCSVEGF